MFPLVFLICAVHPLKPKVLCAFTARIRGGPRTIPAIGVLDAGVFEAVELPDGSIRIVMDVGGAAVSAGAAGVAKVAVSRDIVHVTVSSGRRVRWEGVFHLPFQASKETVSCSLKNSFIELSARPAEPSGLGSK